MYSIYSSIGGHTVCLYDDTVSNPSVKVIEPVLTLEDSSAGSLTFKLAPNNIGYSEITVEDEMVDHVDSGGEVVKKKVTRTLDLVARMQSTIRVYRDGEEIWEGRVLSEERDFQNLRSIYCEGELSYLNDTCQPQRQYHDITLRQFLETVIALHNARVDESKQFTVGAVTVSDNLDISYRYTQFEKTMEVVNNLVNDYGGHLRIRKVNGVRYLDYLAEYPNVNSQQIKFGSNLLDFTCSWDMSELCTVVMPTGHVVREATSTTIGDPIAPINPDGVPTTGQFLYVERSTNRIELKADPSLAGYRTAEYVVEPGKNYYVSCRLHGDLVMYAIYTINQLGQYEVLDYKQAGSGSQIGYTDLIDQKINIPLGGSRVIVCGWGTDVPVMLKGEIEATEGLDEYLTVEECANDGSWHQQGSVYVTNQELITKYGWIEKQIAFSEVEDKDVLYQNAKTYLKDGQFDEMTIEISAIDLSIFGVDYERIKLLDQICVISEPHDLNRLFPVTKLEIPLDDPSGQKFTIGSKTGQTLTSVNNDVNEDMLAKISAVPSETLVSAQKNAAQLINMATNGYITLINDEDGNPKELLITNEKDYTVAQRVWRWNINGLGYSNHGYNASQYVSAMTMDGAIVADRITVGTLASIKIRGCTAVFGGMDNTDGTVLIKSGDSSGFCVELRNGGIYFGYLNQNGTIDTVGHIRDDKVFMVDGQPKRGIVIDGSILALDISHMWVSEKSSYDSGDMKTMGAFSGKLYAYADPSGSTIVDLNFRHGILMSGGV